MHKSYLVNPFHDFIFKSALGIFVSFEITRFLSVVVGSLKNGIQITNQKYDWLNEWDIFAARASCIQYISVLLSKTTTQNLLKEFSNTVWLF